MLRISIRKIDRIKRRFVEDGFEIALTGHKAEKQAAE
jgi:hypothetical protein